ncbi:ATP-binding protein [Actinospica durhamensis]|uniref:histidine kinase n=1 Tax=Actinospica durhamensis TaxID=1508375 RepID=A0A941EQV8_9ACTN|nr:histidine kinase [Actinospica durhamensis]MBR7834843.1 ATP-binding protein [Actinospica durhamensis]
MRPGSVPPEDSTAGFEESWSSPIARRFVRAARRLRRADQRNPLPVDSLLALLVLMAGLTGTLLPHHARDVDPSAHAPTALFLITVVGQSVPLAWRRKAPVPVLAIVLVASAVQWSAGDSARSAIGLLIAIYTVARYEPPKRLFWIMPCLIPALAVSALRVQPFKQQLGYSLFFLCATVVAAAALALVVRARQAQLHALAERATRLEVEREQRVQLAILDERSRVSREMHDIIGHALAVIVSLADGAGGYAAIGQPERAAEVLPGIASTGRQALSELRRTLSALSEGGSGRLAEGDLAPQPGIADVPALLERFQAAAPHLRIAHRTAGDLAAVPPGIQLTVYRIVQEALTNSLKHAGPHTAVQIVVRVADQQVEVHVQDSGGPGQDPAEHTEQSTGRGLVGIRERASLAGGTAQFGPSDGGWRLEVVLPLSPQAPKKEKRP